MGAPRCPKEEAAAVEGASGLRVAVRQTTEGDADRLAGELGGAAGAAARQGGAARRAADSDADRLRGEPRGVRMWGERAGELGWVRGRFFLLRRRWPLLQEGSTGDAASASCRGVRVVLLWARQKMLCPVFFRTPRTITQKVPSGASGSITELPKHSINILFGVRTGI